MRVSCHIKTVASVVVALAAFCFAGPALGEVVSVPITLDLGASAYADTGHGTADSENGQNSASANAETSWSVPSGHFFSDYGYYSEASASIHCSSGNIAYISSSMDGRATAYDGEAPDISSVPSAGVGAYGTMTIGTLSNVPAGTPLTLDITADSYLNGNWSGLSISRGADVLLNTLYFALEPGLSYATASIQVFAGETLYLDVGDSCSASYFSWDWTKKEWESHSLFTARFTASAVVPEPGTLSLLATCFISAIIFRWRRRS